MIVVEVGRPPGDRRQSLGECDGVLPGAGADLQHIAAAAPQKGFEHRRNGRMVAVERRRVEAAIIGRRAIFPEFDNKLRHAESFYATTVSQPPSWAMTCPVT